jgi:lactoylglutathione lyase
MSTSTRLGALVLTTNRTQALVRFYRILGAPLEEERHGEGPLHFACELGPVHFAVYEGIEGVGDASTLVGFSVANLAAVLEELRVMGTPVLREPESRPWGTRAIVSDPDGRRIEVWQPG